MESEDTALFIGKFQPPHIGHLLTINKLKSKYKKLVIGVTEGEPNFVPVSTVIEIFEALLGVNDIEYQEIKGAVDKGTEQLNFEFDVVCSGNFDVLHRLSEKGYRVEFVDRSSDE